MIKKDNDAPEPSTTRETPSCTLNKKGKLNYKKVSSTDDLSDSKKLLENMKYICKNIQEDFNGQ